MATIRKRVWVTGKGEERQAWVASFVDGSGRRRQLQFARRRDADAELLRARNAVAEGTYTAHSGSPTIAAALDAWIARGVAEHLERSTITSYTLHRRHVLELLPGAMKLSRLTRPRVEQLRDQLLTRHARSTAAKILRDFRSAIADAARRGTVAQNVARDVRIGRSTRHEEPITAGRDFPTIGEMKAILEAAADRPKALAFIVLAGLAGMRASEIRGLAWSSVDLGKAPAVEVVQRADRWSQIGPPKSAASRRTIPLGEIAVDALRAWKLRQPGGRALVFGTRSGLPDQLFNLKRSLLWPVLKKAATPQYGPHSLRHFAISNWLRSCGGDFKEVQRRAGHATLALTLDVYGHLLPRPDERERIIAAEAELR